MPVPFLGADPVMSDKKSSQSTSPTTSDHHEDELVHVPKGQSRVGFILMVIVILAILVAFSITPAMMSTLSGNPGGATFVSWQVPGSEPLSMDSDTFRAEKLRLNALQEVLRVGPPLPTGQFDAKSDEQVAKFMIVEELAQKSGMRTSDEEVRELIVSWFGNEAAYLERVRGNRRVTPKTFEEALRRWVLVNRYLSWMAQGAALVDPAEVQDEWLAGHQEYAFDYVIVPIEDYRTNAEEQLPADEELRAWFEAKSENEKRRFQTGPFFSAEAAYLSLPQEVAPEKLIAAYPPGEDEDVDAAARGYYDLYYTTRFKKPEGVSEGEEDLYFAFEDVKDICAIEVGAFNAMNLWMLDLEQMRKDQKDIDLVAEAERLGLEYGKQEQALTRTEWAEVELPWSGSYVMNDIVRGQTGQMGRKITVEAQAFVITRVIERVEPSVPDFAEIREQVAEEWIKQKMGDVAVLRLEQVRDVLGNRPADPTMPWELVVDGEKFGQAAVERGFTPKHRDFIGRREGSRPPAGEVDDDETAAIREFLARNNQLYQLLDGQVAEPRTDPKGRYAYLVRLSGSRDADIQEKLAPADVTSIESRLSEQSSQEFLSSTYGSTEWFVERMRLRIVDPMTGEPLL
jgi:hypothetical protein